MNEYSKKSPKERQQLAAARQRREALKRPYMVQSLQSTILYLTAEQAAKRLDLIPQFTRQPLDSNS